MGAKKDQGFSVFWPREKWSEKGKTPKIPFLGLSLLPNRTETLATQARLEYTLRCYWDHAVPPHMMGRHRHRRCYDSFNKMRAVGNCALLESWTHQHEEKTRGTPFLPLWGQTRHHVARKLSLNPSSPNVENAPPITPKQIGQNGKQSVCPSIKDICQNSEIDTKEKELLIKKKI